MKLFNRSGLRFSILMTCASVIPLLIGNKVSASNTYPQLILSDNPVAYYRLEETDGAPQAIDSSTNQINANFAFDVGPDGTFPELGQPGIDTNCVFMKYYQDSSLAFHNGDIDIPYSPLLNPANPDGTGTPFSAEIWLYPTAQPPFGGNDYRVPFSEFGGYGGGIYGNASGWNFYQSPGPSSRWILNVHQAGIFAQAPTTIQLLNWYHLAVTFDGTNFVFYINGVAVNTSSGVGYLANPGADEHIGTGANVGFFPFDGGEDEAAIYGYTLTPAQILAHYQLGTNSIVVNTNVAPFFLTQPSSATNYSGTPVTFTATANGTTPLHYQWLRGATKIPGATNSSFTFTSHFPADDGATFTLSVTNVAGATNSAPVTLSVATNVNIVAAPYDVTRNSGSNSWVTFRVTANGALPISYQWNDATSGTDVKIPGATNASLWFKGLSTNATYDVVVSNPFITNSPLPASLTVQTRPINVPITKYAQLVVSDSPVAYWRLDETNADGGTATDAVGSFDGTYTDGSGPFIFDLPTAIPHETNFAVGLTNGCTIQIPFALELNPSVTWSAETWIQPYSLGANGNDYRVVLSSQFNQFPNPYNGWYLYQQPNANNFALAPQPGNGFITANPNDPAHGNVIVPFQWYHVVITDDGITFTVYINGQARASFPVAGDQFIANGDGILPNGTIGRVTGLGNTVIGQRTDLQFSTFIGTVDDTAFYNYALSAAQVTSHYQNGVKITATQVGKSLVVSWPFGTLQSAHSIKGPYLNLDGATSPYTNSISTTNTYYRVQTQ